jgi:C-terminal processing protease CtpA/Prc
MNRTATFLSALAYGLAGAAAPSPSVAEVGLKPGVAPAAIMDGIGATVRRDFYDPEGLGEFNTGEARFRAAAQSGPGIAEAAAAWLATLKATHTGRFTPDTIDYYELSEVFHRGLGRRRFELFPPEGVVTYPGIGMVPRTLDGKLFVAYVYDGGPADRAGLVPGDELLAVDGKPYAPIASFEGKAGRSVKVELRRTSGAAPMTADVPVERLQPRDVFLKAIRDSVRIVEHDGRRLGYIRLWAFAVSGVEELIMELLVAEPLKSADGLIVDMRGRWGGAPANAADIFVGDAPLVELTDRDGDVHIAHARWPKPLVGIIDVGSRSGMEILAHGLKGAGVPLIGMKTAGAVVAGRAYLLPDDSLLEVAVLDVRVDGVRLEGVGVTPDIEVEFDLRYANGADPQLDRAAAELGAMLRD